MFKQENINAFNMEKPNDDPNLVTIVGMLLESTYGKVHAENFLNDKDIQSCVNSVSGVQRIIINRYFNSKLLIFRADNEIDVTDILATIVFEGDDGIWFTLIKGNAIPFMVKHNII